MRGLQLAQVQAALSTCTLVRTTCMRATLFFVPAKDLAVFVRGSARRAEREIRPIRGKGLSARVIDELIGAVLGVCWRHLPTGRNQSIS